jgi:RimJ/RimL family protein N-acetyltransferase/aryl carrier-like protein
MTVADAPAGTRREAYRTELAELLDVEPGRLRDEAALVDDLCLDSLAMMALLTWLQARGVTVGSAEVLPSTVGAVLSLLDRVAVPGLSITFADPPREFAGTGPAVPPLTAGPRAPLPGSGSPLAARLATPALRLTPVQPDDVGFLYSLAVAPETGYRWRYRGAPPSFDRFAAELWNQVLVQFVVRRAADGRPVGNVVAYAAHPGLRHACIGAVFEPKATGGGLAAQAVELFVRYLFHTFPLRKLYLEVPGFNWPQLRSGEGRVFQVEGILRDHLYYAGRSWDQYLCAIYPDTPVDGAP